jgi:hypothetical protein
MGAFGVAIPVTGLNNGFPGTISRTNAGEPSILARLANASNTNNISFGDPVVLQQDATGGTYTQVADWITNSSGLITPKRSPIAPVTHLLPFGGIAVREVKTMLQYPLPPGTAQVGYYSPGQMCDVMTRGSITVKLGVKTGALAGGPVYLRILVDAAVSSALGSLEAQPDVCLATTMTGATITNSIVVASYTNLANGMIVTGYGIPDGTYITNVSTTTITLSQNITSIIPAGTPVTFAWTLMLPDVIFRTGVVDANNVAEITIESRVG